jgi:3-deoxy-D-manno-octulosonic-acid transferase
MFIIYQIGIYLYYLLIIVVSAFNKKAKQWLVGRKSQQHLFHKPLVPANRIWFHFASLGEFEQGRVLLEKVHLLYPDYKFIVTFFSPSGYEIRKNYALAEKVYYLPLDTAKNAKQFLNHIQPSLIFFNKYEYWFHYISEANKSSIPLFVTSAIFRESQSFFKPYGTFQKKILTLVHYFFVQDDKSLSLLKSINVNKAIVAGDTRFDRVYEHALAVKNDEFIEDFCAQQKVFVAGSTWPADEHLLKQLLQDYPELKLIIVPHEIDNTHINQLFKMYADDAALYTDYMQGNYPSNKRVLIVNTIGLLNSIYKHARYCYIGGGFGAGIHNTLEAAAFGKVIFFGPNYKKFKEAVELINIQAAFSIRNYNELNTKIEEFEHSEMLYTSSCENAKNYVHANKGATDLILSYLKKEKYLD